MNRTYNPGETGYFDFSIRKKDRYGNMQTTHYVLFATIKEVEEKNILIEDNDGYPYLVTNSRIKSFTKEELTIG